MNYDIIPGAVSRDTMESITNKKLADNAIAIDGLRALARAQAEGRLIILPCKLGDTLYTLERGNGCDDCEYYRGACNRPAKQRCPTRVRSHIAEGFEIILSGTGDTVLLGPGYWEYEDFVTIGGVDNKWYFTRAEAEAALQQMEDK